MRVLALETSTGRGSLALLDDTAIDLAVAVFRRPRARAQTFSVAIADALRRRSGTRTVCRLVATTNGPRFIHGAAHQRHGREVLRLRHRAPTGRTQYARCHRRSTAGRRLRRLRGHGRPAPAAVCGNLRTGGGRRLAGRSNCVR